MWCIRKPRARAEGSGVLQLDCEKVSHVVCDSIPETLSTAEGLSSSVLTRLASGARRVLHWKHSSRLPTVASIQFIQSTDITRHTACTHV